VSTPFPILRHGVDLVSVERFREALERTEGFEARVFTERERAYCRKQADPTIHFAARFAAKEALLKALGTGLAGIGLHTGLHEVEVVRDESGAPRLVLTGRAAKIAAELGAGEPALSLTHTKENAVASVVLLVPPAEKEG
jgi:holo-[acyl-carrier protein] synthase